MAVLYMNYIIFFAFLYVSYLKFCSSFKFHLIFQLSMIIYLYISSFLQLSIL